MSRSESSLSGRPHSADEVREAVTEVLPEVAVREASGVEEGRNMVYLVTTDNSRPTEPGFRSPRFTTSP